MNQDPSIRKLSIPRISSTTLAAAFVIQVASLMSTAATFTEVNLSNYVRVGRYDLPEPTRTTPPDGVNLLAQEVSGVTYNWDTDTLFVVGDGGTAVVQVSKTGQLVDSMTLATGSSPQGTEFYDPEGITYIGGGQFVMTEERDRQLVLFTYAAGTTLQRSATKTVKLGTFVQNIGFEGVSYDPKTSGFIVVKEISPLGVFQTTVDFDAGTASNGSPTTENSVDLFNPLLTGMSDIADVFALSNIPGLAGQSEYDNLLILSQEDARIINIDRAGNIHSSLTIYSDPGNLLSVASQQHEGLAMDRDGILYVVSENGGGDADHPQLWVYAPASSANTAPTGIQVDNATTSIQENTAVLSPIKVGDVRIVDDGLGVNGFALSGADAASFDLVGFELFLKTGTVLDYEAKTNFTVTVAVDDVTVGVSPDASVVYNLAVTDVADETVSGPSLIISEVAPWSSGNSPVGEDWFELSNTGNAPVDITGWKFDDGSAVFASAVDLVGITEIGPGESVIFVEGTDLTATRTLFLSNWFGTNTPAGLQVGIYSGSGVGLSSGGDGVHIFDATGTLKAGITFGASPAGPFPTFDNAVGLDNTLVTNASVVRLHGAFEAAQSPGEIGSPGTVGKLIISEVAPWSSGNSPVGEDWFEVSNTSARPIDISNWKVDDGSQSPAAAVPLVGITSIAPGESVIFLETADLPTTKAAFLQNWFGTNAPAGLQFGSYNGSGLGLSSGGDGVNLYDSLGNLRASVNFGASPSGPYPTFDNSEGRDFVILDQLSRPGLHGAFVAPEGDVEVGSPGTLGGIVISEVAPWSSGNSPLGEDWFEVYNSSPSPIDITGWTMDDSSASFGSSVALNGVNWIAPGEAVIFIDTADSTNLVASFRSLWFGAHPPADLQIGTYTGSGIGLSSGGDGVTLFNASGLVQASVSFGASPSGPFPTFDNSFGYQGRTLVLPSVQGVRGAFAADADDQEIGSPGWVQHGLVSLPTVQITRPSINAVLPLPGNSLVEATASSAGGVILQVEFYLDSASLGSSSSAPYLILVDPVTSGAHTLAAVAVDELGLRATNSLGVVASQLPSVALNFPGSVVTYEAPADILLDATVGDADGSVASVRFYNGQILLSEITGAPFQFNWTGVPNGVYTITAVVTDDQGLTQVSDPTHVVVGTVGMVTPKRTSGGEFQFQFAGQLMGLPHLIQASTNLSSPTNWVTIGTITPGSNIITFTDSGASTNGLRYYRVIQDQTPQ